MSEFDKFLKDTLEGAERVTKDYINGGFLFVSKRHAFIKYNTGDCVWFELRFGKYYVSRVDTHDDQFVEC